MKLNTKSRYAVMALADLAKFSSHKPVSLRDISLRQNISIFYLEQIFLKLKKNNILKSIRGVNGGYVLNKKPDEIKIAEIFSALDQKVKTMACKKDIKKSCTGKLIKCITHNLWDELDIHINNFFESKKLSDLLNKNQNSILEFKNVNDQILELNSLSKSHNMAGWRIGMLAGGKNLIDDVLKVKSNMDSGMFFAVQKAAIKALNLDNNWYDSINTTYKKRRSLVWQIMDHFNAQYDRNATGMFIWAKLNNNDSIAFTEDILKKHAVFITPGDIFGKNGTGYIRMSLCSNEAVLNEILNRINR